MDTLPDSRRDRAGVSGESTRSRWLLTALPALTVLVLAFALFVVGASRPYVSARVYGGPLAGQAEYHLRVAVAERMGEVESPRQLGLRVHARAADGREATWGGISDPQGNAEVDLRFDAPTAGPLELSVQLDSAQAELPAGFLLAQGKAEPSLEAWEAGLTRGVTWSQRSRGELALRVSAERGTFAVPFEDWLWVEVTHKDHPVAGADVELRLEGGAWIVDGKAVGSSRQLATNEDGRLRARLAPEAHVLSLEVRASVEQAEGAPLKGRLAWQLPVLPGALDARLDDQDPQRLVVRSPVERAEAYVALVDERGRWGGASIKLAPAVDGTSRGEFRLPSATPAPGGRPQVGALWALVSSEPDFRSAGCVGWPLADAHAGPVATLKTSEIKHLDGFPAAYARDQARVARARWLGGGVALLAGLIAVVFLLQRARRSQAKLEAHLAAQEELGNTELGQRGRFQAPAYSWALLLGVLCVGLCFLLLALIALYRAS